MMMSRLLPVAIFALNFPFSHATLVAAQSDNNIERSNDPHDRTKFGSRLSPEKCPARKLRGKRLKSIELNGDMLELNVVKNKKKSYKKNDVLGAMVKSDKPNRLFLSYLHQKSKEKRVRRDDVFQCDSATESKRLAEEINELVTLNNSEMKYLVFINPNAGKNQGVAIWEKQVKPIFDAVPSITYEAIVTKKAGEAGETVQKNGLLKKYTGIIVVSGDGLLFEVFQGIRQCEYPLNEVSVGIIPAGSGNGLSASVFLTHNVRKKTKTAATTAAWLIAKGFKGQLDVAKCDLNNPDEEKDDEVTIFLSVEWGFIGDVDIESDWMRKTPFAGSTRFDLWALRRLMPFSLRRYAGTFYFWPENDEALPAIMPPLGEELSGGWQQRRGEFLAIWTGNTARASDTTYLWPNKSLNDGFWDVMVVDVSGRPPALRSQLLSIFLKLSSGGHVKLMGEPGIERIRTKAFRLVPRGDPNASIIGVDGEKMDHYGPIQARIEDKQVTILGAITSTTAASPSPS